ncbi:unnamed protein product [Spirodela intermedia]|uniref:Uncharacterized protein n=1 Tax=Spirodela intermedia TaxID=51605 RepID=A0A7I8LLA9_SPIIN|nr:unnamed protein product [Spirodela intermedia]
MSQHLSRVHVCSFFSISTTKLEIVTRRPPPKWQAEGRIDLEDLKEKRIQQKSFIQDISKILTPSYRPNAPLVLKGITCTFAAGHKVGVVGRTASGKRTLLSALVRSNLDPLGLHADHEIWEGLEKCQLKKTVASFPDFLDSTVSDEGDNWSAGQRRATASIDFPTDATLRRIIKQEFGRFTVITVVHRVPTRSIVEYDVPSRLMVESGSAFSNLVAEYWSSCRSDSSRNLSSG